MLTLEGCRQRQQRFLNALAEAKLDGMLITHPRDIYYFTGMWVEFKIFDFPSLLVLGAGQKSLLATWQQKGEFDAVVDDRAYYPPGMFSTMNPDNCRRLAKLVRDKAAQYQGKFGRIGYQAEGGLKHIVDVFLETTGATAVAADDLLIDQQLRKDPDEIECIRKSEAADLAGYAKAVEIIQPGMNELDVLAECTKAAIRKSGKPHYFGGDFRSGERGGPARDRQIQKGELYIIDAQADVDGYWSDLSRAWVVGGEPTDLQQSVYDHIASIVKAIPDMVKPGLDCREFFRHLDAKLREHPHLADVGLTHHGGHGIGLRAHEGPDIGPERPGTFEVGNVFTVEPGAYTPELQAGIRLENNFLLTENGVEVLSDFPFEITQAKH